MKKGQSSASGAATFIGVLTLILVFYILLIPPSDRLELLDNVTDDDDDDSRDTDDEFDEGFLTEFVGSLGAADEEEVEHLIPNILLVETKNAVEFERFNPFIVSSSWFGSKDQVVDFSIPDLDDAQNIILTFASRGKGLMGIKLNDNLIYESEALPVNTVVLRKSLLKEGSNTLEFFNDGVGLRFWAQDSYSISDAKVIGDVTDFGRQESVNVFTITDDEFRTLDSSRLSFIPVCNQVTAGVLEVYINDRKVSSSIPDCDGINRVDLFREDLYSGKNTLIFRITEGSYRIENIRVNTEAKDADTFAAFFEVTRSNYTELRTDQVDAWLNITFIDDDKDKEAEVNINGRLLLIDQKEDEYSRDVSDQLREGNNYIEITPRTSLNIVKVEIIPR